MINMIGNTDRPIINKSEDVFGINQYIKGLSRFICDCDTPMTVAIQGDWGSGKTSFMNMIRQETNNDVVDIWFNTWQFSQFNLGDSLSITLLSSLLDRLDADIEVKQHIKKFIKGVSAVGSAVATKLTDADTVDAFLNGLGENGAIESISKLKENFQKCVDATLEKRKKEKLVIFVDDLDRLSPERAVEILEVLKLFLDCEHCVFVLAIDYDVVCRGISQKYGEDFDKKKGKSFFDKIIQVPFKMPITNYDIKKYIVSALNEMKFSIKKPEVYVNLISRSIGYNPRGLKRIFNAFLLLKMIYTDVALDTPQKQTMLFAVLCLQLSYENLYNYFVINENGTINAELLNTLSVQDGKGTENFYEIAMDLEPEADSEELKSFIEAFCNAIKNVDNVITDMEIDLLEEIFQISGTTSASLPFTTTGNGKEGKGIRHGNTFDNDYSLHSIAEHLEQTNAPTGWNGCELDSYQLFGNNFQASNFTQLVLDVLAQLYKRDEKRFREVMEEKEKYKLRRLFYVDRPNAPKSAPRPLPGATDIIIETKSNYDDKVRSLRKMFEALKIDCGELKLNIKLAHRTDVIPAENAGLSHRP